MDDWNYDIKLTKKNRFNENWICSKRNKQYIEYYSIALLCIGVILYIRIIFLEH